MGQPTASVLFIFVIFKQHFTEKTVGFSGTLTRIVRVEGKQADHRTALTLSDEYLT